MGDFCSSTKYEVLTVKNAQLPSSVGHAIAQAITGFPPWWPRFNPRSGYVGSVVDKATLGHIFSKYFGYPY
jgi:hypothetical protein